MEKVFDQFVHVRAETIKEMDGLTEEIADKIPIGFRNHIRWHLGHMFFVTEYFAYTQLGLPLNLPNGFKERYPTGTSPLDDLGNIPTPTLPELKELLSEQPEKIRKALTSRLDAKTSEIKSSTGLAL